MNDTTILVLIGAAGLAGGWLLRRASELRREPGAGAATADPGGAAAPPEDRPERETEPPHPVAQLYALREPARAAHEAAAVPDDLPHDPRFGALAAWLRDGPFDEAALLRYYDGACPTLAAAAVVALAARGPSEAALDALLRELQDCDFFTRHFALRLLRQHSIERALPGLLARLDPSWQHPWGRRVLADHLAACFEALDGPVEDTPAAEGSAGDGLRDDGLGDGATGAAALAAAVRANDDVEDAFVAELTEPLGDRGAALARILHGEATEAGPTRTADAPDREPGTPGPGVGFLRSFARVLTRSGPGEGPIVDPVTQAHTDAIARALASRRSVVVVGEHGVGKSAAIRALADRLLDADWTVFEAGAIELMAGQKYIGQLEERLRLLIDTFREAGRRLLWIVPDLHELAWAGRHDNNPTSILDHVLPQVDDGTVVLVGETRPAAWERTVQLQPAVKHAVEVVAIAPRRDGEALALARAWHARLGARAPALEETVLREALQLARHHLDDTALPGSLVRLLGQAVRDHGDDRTRSLDRADLLAAIGTLTGLPRDVLDDRTRLDLAALRTFFEGRVMGQPDAIEALVERVAMIKAGLTDPGRPQGTFLFTGPTGTGKTELAKTLAAWLFGSPERTVRFDMSELQDAGALDRMLGGGGPHDTTQSLAQRIRQQPFSVVLLDEIEKAHPAVWDLLLQVLDDGRLTDRRGRLADFRHAILIMTSNAGALRAQGASLGFGATSHHAVVDELKKTFRPEFLNRIDRIVVFRPLTEATMRLVLEKELHRALERRGLRTRQWAVEWDGTALDFLLREGFSPELGARPLRRAIEHHLLAPLARTIVQHEAPAGDQFLFVRSDGRRIDVRFVDPDAPDGRAPADAVAEGGPLDLAAVALDATGTAEELALVEHRLLAIEDGVGSDAWRQRKQAALDATSDPAFWTSADRFAVLGTAEYIDRIHAGLHAARRLLGRLRGGRGDRTRCDATLLRQLAQRVLLLEQAMQDVEKGAPQEAFVAVEAVHDPVHEPDGSPFAARLVEMYEAWGRARGMTVQVLEHRPPAGPERPFRAVLAVAGFGAWSVLEPEHGLHVLETDGPRPHATARLRVRVSVAPQPSEPPRPDTPRGRTTQARRALDARGAGPDIVRRYREAPSPLCRDAVRGWRTGRVDRVFGGDFDLIR